MVSRALAGTFWRSLPDIETSDSPHWRYCKARGDQTATHGRCIKMTALAGRVKSIKITRCINDTFPTQDREDS